MGALCAARKTRHFVVTIGAGQPRFGLIVDGLIRREELVIKAFEDRLVASDLVSGASILATEAVVLILNVLSVVSHLTQKRVLEATHEEPVRVLVVDDSAVMRKLIPQLLQGDPSIEVVGTADGGCWD